MRVYFEADSGIQPELSIVLANGSVRESLHSIEYLNAQSAPRSAYELLWIEFYDRSPAALRQRVSHSVARGAHPAVDFWLALGLPRTTECHKHLLYNAGLVASRGRFVLFCDSDAIFRPSFVASVLAFLRREPDVVLHLDEVRCPSHDFSPFAYPSLAEVQSRSRGRLRSGRPEGLAPGLDRLHRANYGACMAAPRNRLIEIGGADEHADYLGHICGPYEMTFRLANLGLREQWHPDEWLYHVGHPGESGGGDRIGPHDGRGMSATALRARDDGRVLPLVENPAIRALREGRCRAEERVARLRGVKRSGISDDWSHDRLLSFPLAPVVRRTRVLHSKGVASRWLARVPLDAAEYGRLVLRSTGRPYSKRVRAPRLGAIAAPFDRAASAAHKLRKLLTRPLLPFRLAARIAREHRDAAARCFQQIDGLCSEGVRAVAIFGAGLLADTVALAARERGLGVLGAFDDAGALAARLRGEGKSVRVVIAARDALLARRAELELAGVERAAIALLAPEWSEREMLVAASPGPAGLSHYGISVIVPTRRRAAIANALLDQLYASAEKPDAVEVVLYIDDDDDESLAIEHPSLELRRIVGPRRTMGSLTNACVAAATRPIVLLFNDDVVVRARGWDTQIAAAFARFPDRIACVYGDDLHQRWRIPTFPAISREAIRALGRVTSARFHHYHIESHLHAIFRRLRRLGHARLVHLPDVVFEHRHAPNHSLAPQERDGCDDRVTYAVLSEERELAARRLAAQIEGRRLRSDESTGATAR